MKEKILYAIVFLCVPVAILITVVVHREPTYHGKSTTVWVEAMRTNRDAALSALQRMGNTSLPALSEKLKAASTTEKCRAAWAMGRLDSITAHAAVPNLIQALNDNNVPVRCAVMMALARIGITNEELAPKLMAQLTDSTTGPFAGTLLNSIERERKAENLPPFAGEGYDYGMACIKSPTPSMRLNGAIQLASVAQKDDRAKAALQSLLTDKNGWVREQVAKLMNNPTALANFRLVSE